MMTLAAAALAMVIVGGMWTVLAAIGGHLPAPDLARPRRSRLATQKGQASGVRPKTWLSLGLGVIGGVVLSGLTQWPVLLVLVPLAVVWVPRLLADPPAPRTALLEALDRWVRTLVAQLGTGKSIPDALRAASRQAPSLLADQLSRVNVRLDDRWGTDRALLALADELDAPDADAVIAALILAAQRGGTGAAVTLAALADSIQDQLRALREIEAERAKPRVVVRQVTWITVLATAGFMLLSPDYFEPYRAPLGQAVLASLVLGYGLALVLLRRVTLPPPRARIIRSAR